MKGPDAPGSSRMGTFQVWGGRNSVPLGSDDGAHLSVESRALHLVGGREALLQLSTSSEIAILHLDVAARPGLSLCVAVLRHLQELARLLHDVPDSEFVRLVRRPSDSEDSGARVGDARETARRQSAKRRSSEHAPPRGLDCGGSRIRLPVRRLIRTKKSMTYSSPRLSPRRSVPQARAPPLHPSSTAPLL